MATDPPRDSQRPSQRPPQGAFDSEKTVKPTLTPPPVLASDVLREDVAPLRPWDKTIRGWILGLGVVLIVAGMLQQLHMVYAVTDGARISLALGSVLILTALLPLPYVLRGVLAASASVSLISWGLLGHGPLAAIVLPSYGVAWAIMRTLAAILLPAALLFRARYRAYRGARYVLATALVLSLPTSLHAITVLISGPPSAQIAAGLSLLAVAASFLGFMGSGTTAAATTWAIAVLVMLGVDVAARSLWIPAASHHWLHVQTGLYFILACTLGALGVFQVLVVTLANDARRVDVLARDSGKSNS